MPRVVEALWFEDVGLMQEPIFNFFVVRLSIRQTIYVFLFAGLALFTSMWFADMAVKLLVAAVVFIVGAGTFMRRGKTFSPEWYTLRFGRMLVARLKPHGKRRRAWSQVSEKTRVQRKKQMLATSEIGEPVRIAGTLFSPSSGKRLGNTDYEVYVDGQPYWSGHTEPDGSYAVLFTPPGNGLFSIEIRPAGHAKNVEHIRLQVVPKGTRAPVQETAPEKKTEKEPVVERAESQRGYVYELFPTNFATLADHKQDEVVNRFRNFLNSLEREIRIHTIRTSKTVEVKEQRFETEFYRFFIESKEPIDYNLDIGGFRYQRVTELPTLEVVRGFRRFCALSGGRTVQTSTVYRMPAQLTEGFLSELYGAVDRVTICVRPFSQDVAVAKMRKYTHVLKGMIYADAQRFRAPREETQLKVTRADGLSNNLLRGRTRLFEFTLNLTVGGRDTDEVRNNMKRVKAICGGQLLKLDAPQFVQTELLRGDEGKHLIMDTITVGAHYPFASADVTETPGGIYLGQNQLTGAPVIYDYYLRENYNVMILGKSGAGKSMAIKIMINRLKTKYPDLAFFLIDPEGEYSRVAAELGGEVVRISRDEELGLDPLILFADNKGVAVEMLADLIGIAEGDPALLSELKVGVEHARNLSELYKRSSKQLQKYLRGLLRGPDRFLTAGDPIRITDRMSFNLKDLHRALMLSRRHTGTLHTASLLLFGKLWNEIERMPPQRVKLVVVDEVWLYTALPAAAAFLEQVARRGRKRNVIFLLASQRPADVLDVPAGKATLENCATKVILGQDESAASLVAQTFGLTEAEREAILGFSPGTGILMAKDIKVGCHFVATDEEYPIFTTKPTEVE